MAEVHMPVWRRSNGSAADRLFVVRCVSLTVLRLAMLVVAPMLRGKET
jgi:hypothetical protein